MKWFMPVIVSLLIYPISSCKKKMVTEYQLQLQKIPDSVKIDTNKHLSFILYNPLTCLSCNLIIATQMRESVYQNSFGPNSFIVFPSIRAEELNDFKKNLEEYGHISINYLNDKALYELLRSKNKNKNDTRPAFVCLNKNTDQYVYIVLKEINLADSFKKYFPN